jgi:dUTP pyrophosphatase
MADEFDAPFNEVRFVRLSRTAICPRYATTGSAGLDLSADESAEILGGERKLISCGFAMALPVGWEAQIRPRSGLALRDGITVLNSPGTIDSDYRGPIGVLLYNTSLEPFEVKHGARIAQMVIARFERIRLRETTTLDETLRGVGGFGSTEA